MFKRAALFTLVTAAAATAGPHLLLTDLTRDPANWPVTQSPDDPATFEIVSPEPGKGSGGELTVTGRVPAADGGQYLYIRYTSYLALSGDAYLRSYGFALACDEGVVTPALIAFYHDQSFYETGDQLYLLYYPPPLSGPLTLVVQPPGRPSFTAALGRAEKPVFRVSVVSAEDGVQRRAGPSPEAAAEGILPPGEKVYHKGLREIYEPEEATLEDFDFFYEIIIPGGTSWVGYTEEGGIEDLPFPLPPLEPTTFTSIPGEPAAFAVAAPGVENDDRVVVYARKPAPYGAGQYLYVRFRSSDGDVLDGRVMLRRAGFELAGDGGAVSPENVAFIPDRSYYDTGDGFYILFYPTASNGALTLVIQSPGGPRVTAALGDAAKALYRTGVVTAEEGVPLRAEPSRAAPVETVLPPGTKVYFAGQEGWYYPDLDAEDFLGDGVCFRRVVWDGGTSWVEFSPSRYGYPPYIEEGGLEELP